MFVRDWHILLSAAIRYFHRSDRALSSEAKLLTEELSSDYAISDLAKFLSWKVKKTLNSAPASLSFFRMLREQT